jgi:type III restriction enzyme
MTTNKNNVSIELARRLTATVNAAWESGEMLRRVTPTTQQLLTWWLAPEHCEQRRRNFHDGQRQAILNIIYLHEVLGVSNVMDSYQMVAEDLLDVADLSTLSKPKYQMPKYAVKMATGTGKTWVMHALLLWQLLNAKNTTVDPPLGSRSHRL